MIDRNNLDSVRREGVSFAMTKGYQYFKNQATVDFNSEEGIKILDKWVNDWKLIFNIVYKKYGRLVCDLSGGCDTRVLLVLIMLAGLKDKTIFYTKAIENERQSKQIPVKKEDLEIAKKLADTFELKLETSLKLNKYPRVSGLDSCFKSYQSISAIARSYSDLDKYNTNFMDIMSLWCAQHPDADVYDKKQMAFEIGYYQWHDEYKIEKEAKEGHLVLCPFNEPEIKKLKSKGYKLWKFFMERYCPKMLKFPLQGRGLISDVIATCEAFNKV